jgi:hypothetical protein
METYKKKVGSAVLRGKVSLALAVVFGLGLALPAGAVTNYIQKLSPSWTAVGGGGVYSAYIGPADYNLVCPGAISIFAGREAGIIKAGLAVVTVKKQGTAAADGRVLRVWANHYAAASVGEAGDVAASVGSLAVGASTTLTLGGLTAPSANGTYTVRAFIDSQGATVEQSEGNNQKTKTYGFY